jgi:hypothetical protein
MRSRPSRTSETRHSANDRISFGLFDGTKEDPTKLGKFFDGKITFAVVRAPPANGEFRGAASIVEVVNRRQKRELLFVAPAASFRRVVIVSADQIPSQWFPGKGIPISIGAHRRMNRLPI